MRRAVLRGRSRSKETDEEGSRSNPEMESGLGVAEMGRRNQMRVSVGRRLAAGHARHEAGGGPKDGFPVFLPGNWAGGAAVCQDVGDYGRNILAGHSEGVWKTYRVLGACAVIPVEKPDVRPGT